jgi:hypothetical protein
MVDADDARLALSLTLQDVAEYFHTSLSNRTPAEAAYLLKACIPVLDGLGCPYTPTRRDGSVLAIEHFTLRADTAPETHTPLLPSTLVLALTDIADYLAHLSRGGNVNYAMENYVAAHCLGLLDEIGVRHPRRSPLS